MGRFNAELDDVLHQQFVDYAKARGVTMKQIVEEFLRSLLAAPSTGEGGVAVIEIHLGTDVQTRVDRDGQRIQVHVTGQWVAGARDE